MIRIADEVRSAIADGRGVVALETTLVAHGFPPGEGVEVGLALGGGRPRGRARRRRRSGSSTARSSSASRATELERFDASARKIGPRDVAAAVAQRAVGATTVGGTLAVCRAAGIRFMATGGLGGVHRGWPTPPDVSADLLQLARTRRARRLLGRQVAARRACDGRAARVARRAGARLRGPTRCRSSTRPHGGPPVSARVESAGEAAALAAAHWELVGGGLLLGRPPDETLDDVEPLIERALAEAESAGVHGQAVTPFVLSFLHRESGGRTLRANRDLIVANARLAGEIAAADAER